MTNQIIPLFTTEDQNAPNDSKLINLVKEINKVATKNAMTVIKNDPIIVSMHSSSGQELEFQVDCGSQVSMLRESLVQKLPKTLFSSSKSSDSVLVDVQNKEIKQTRKPIVLDLVVGDQTIKQTFYVTNASNLLGLDFLNDHKVAVEFNNLGTHLYVNSDGQQSTPISAHPNKKVNSIAVRSSKKEAYINEVTIEHGEHVISGTTELPDGEYDFCTVEAAPIKFANAVRVENGTFRTEARNTVGTPLYYQQDEIIAYPEKLENHRPCFIDEFFPRDLSSIANLHYVNAVRVKKDKSTIEIVPEEPLPPFPEKDEPHLYTPYPLNDRLSDIELERIEPEGFPHPDQLEYEDWEAILRTNTHIPQPVMNDLIRYLIHDVPGVISKHPFDIGVLNRKYNFFQKLETTGPPICCKPYKLDALREDQMDQMFKFLEEIGIVEKGTSAWGIPCFLRSKRNGLLRLIADARLFNLQLKDVKYPIKSVDAVFSSIARKQPKIMTCIDITSGFNSIELDEESKQKAAFITHNAQYIPNRSFFGIKTSPSIFCAALALVLQDVDKDIFEIFMDDVVVMTNTYDPELHLQHVKTILSALYDGGLKILMSKIKWFQSQAEFLGRIIDSQGIQIHPRHVKAVRDYPSPCQSVKQIQQFTGLLAYCSSAIWNYSSKIEPLTRLTRKNVPFIWTEEQENAMNLLKHEVINATHRSYLDENEPVYLATDASKTHYGAMVYQIKSYSLEDLEKLQAEGIFNDRFKNGPSTVEVEHPKVPVFGKHALKLSPINLAADPTKNKPEEKVLELNGTKVKVVDHTINPLSEVSPLVPYLQEENMLHLIKPLAFHSGTMPNSSQSWTSLEHETYGVCQSVNHLYSYLAPAKETYLLSDCIAFCWLFKRIKINKGPISKLVRWLIKLSALPFKIIVSHVKGINQPADCLSRPYPMALKAQESIEGLTAHAVVSPFKVGTVLDLETIDNYIQGLIDQGLEPTFGEDENPGLRKSKKQVMSITTDFTEPLLEFLTLENIKLEQLLDEDIRKIVAKPTDKDVVEKGILYRLIPISGKTSPLKVIHLPLSLLQYALAYHHSHSHVGGIALSKIIGTTYYVKNLVEHCLNFTSACALCGPYKPNLQPKTKQVPMSYYYATRKGEIISLDVLEGFGESKTSPQILIIQDHFSSYKMCLHLKRQTGAEVAKLIEEHWIRVFGPPALAFSDNASTLNRNRNMRKMFDFYKIEPKTSTALSPISHGLIERSVSTISHLLQIILKQTKRKVEQALPLVQLAANSMPSQKNGYLAPQFIMTGQKMETIRQPIKESEVLDPQGIVEFWKKMDQVSAKLRKDYDKYYEKVRARSKGKDLSFKPGTFVYVLDQRVHTHRKLHSKYYLCPWMVTTEWPQVVIVKNFQGITRQVHKNHLKRVNPRFAYLYADLPIRTKFILGPEFVHEDLAEHIKQGTIPAFYENMLAEDDPPPEPRETRAKTKALLNLRESDELDFPLNVSQYNSIINASTATLDNSDSDDDDNDDDTNETEQRVTFDV